MSGNLSADAVQEIRQRQERATAPTACASTDTGRFSGGLQLVPPGICDVAAWRAGPGQDRLTRALVRGGLGRKLWP
jgi:hypothetical protein